MAATALLEPISPSPPQDLTARPSAKPNLLPPSEESAPPSNAPTANHPKIDVSGLITAVECWEDAMKTHTSLLLRVKAIERAGAEPPAELLVAAEFQSQAMREFKKLIRREWRRHPLAAWAAGVHGLGEHSAAYLMAKLNGSAVVAYPKIWVESGQSPNETQVVVAALENGNGQTTGETHVVPAVPKRELYAGKPFYRTVSQLCQYCGYGDPERKRRKGMSQEEAFACGVPLVKARLRLIAESFIKAGNERYRQVYDTEKERTLGRVCATCKGGQCSDGHRHAMALRRVAKEFLKDLWLAEWGNKRANPNELAPAPQTGVA